MIPAMIKAGYPPRYAIGSMATAGSLGIMIPPSVPLVLYGFVTNESVGKLLSPQSKRLVRVNDQVATKILRP